MVCQTNITLASYLTQNYGESEAKRLIEQIGDRSAPDAPLSFETDSYLASFKVPKSATAPAMTFTADTRHNGASVSGSSPQILGGLSFGSVASNTSVPLAVGLRAPLAACVKRS